jgi:hypothetical protein
MTETHPFVALLKKAGLITTPDPPPGTPRTSPTLMSAEKVSRYAQAALDGEISNVTNAPEGQRNDTLNKAAWKLGRLVQDGHLDGQTVIDALGHAAQTIGLTVAEVNRTVPRAINDGGNKRYEPATTATTFDNDIPDAYTLEDDPANPLHVNVASQLTDQEAVAAWVEANLPRIDWKALWEDETEQEWIVEPLLPARRIIALYSPAKTGKSLLMLELAAAVSAGRSVLGQDTTARVVLYVDFENDPRDDIRARLLAMGYKWEDLDNLVYLSYPTLSALDSEAGGRELLAAVTHYRAELVVIDTISRAVDGEENDNDTWLKAYRHTLLKLKQAGVAAIRLDHTGKDEDKGQRGGSAKTGDIDAVWKLSVIDEFQLKLHCDIARMPVAEKDLILIRDNLPHLHHVIDRSSSADQFERQVSEIIVALDRAGLEPDAGRDRARKALTTTGVTASNGMLTAAIKRRKSAAATTHWQDN